MKIFSWKKKPYEFYFFYTFGQIILTTKITEERVSECKYPHLK